MRFFGAPTLCLAAFVGVTTSLAATTEDTSSASAIAAATELLESMPTCGRTCLVEAIYASPCELTDITCSCSNATITAQVELCVAQTCNTRLSLTTKNATETLCQQPIRDRTRSVSYPGVIGGVLALIAYIIRMISRLPRFGSKPGWDDAVMTFAMMEVIALTVLSVVLAETGLGKDIWTLPFDNITKILKIYYFDEDLYLTALPLVKCSILLFYLRVFPQERFRKICYVTMACCIGYGIAFLLVSVWQCQPMHLAWDRWDGEHAGTCNNINAQGWTSAALNVVLDVIVLGLPIPMVLQLNMNTKKKALVLLMFMVGFLVTLVSIFRLQVLVEFGGSTNFSWDYTSVGYWSTSELDLAIICACMPGIHSLAGRFIQKKKAGSTQDPSYNSSYPSKKSHGSSYQKQKSEDDIPLVEPRVKKEVHVTSEPLDV